MEKLDKNTGIDEELKKGLEATSQVSVEKLEAGLKEKQEQAFSGAGKKKEEIWQQIKDEVKRVEEGVGGTRGTEEEVVEAKQGGEDLRNKGSEADGELKSTLDIVMGKYKTEETVIAPEKKLKSSETVTEKDILEKRAEEAKQVSEVEQKVGVEKPKEGVVEDAVGKGAEGEKLRKELDEARNVLALVEKNDPKYSEVQKDYQAKKEAMQNVAYEAKKATLLKRGISEADVETELGKYAREVLVPNFAVAEAAKIQAARSEANPSILEKMKDNKFSKLAYGVVDAYRKANWKKKIALSVGLLGVGVVAGATGGTVSLALAGIVTGGKGIQRFLSGAGTAVATEALIQRSQQKWMEKEGWGKNRHEYIAKQIASLRKGVVEQGELLSEAKIEKSLSEREKMEKSNEINRAVLAGITGTLVGSGAAWQAVKQAGEWTGISGVLGTAKDYWFGHKVAPIGQKDISWKDAEKAIPLPEEPISLEIGTRGPEGALIDEFKKNPELVKKFFGGEVNAEKLGAKVHLLWEAQAKQALANPETLAEMKKLGYPLNEEGYAKMAHRIGKGFIQIDPTGKNIKFADMEYLKNVTKEVKTLVDQPMQKVPSAKIDEYYAQRITEQERLSGIKNTEMTEKSGYYDQRIAEQERLSGVKNAEIIEKSEYYDQRIAEQERLKDVARATKAETVENVQPKAPVEPLHTEPSIKATASVEQTLKTGLGAEVKAPVVEHTPEVKVEDLLIKERSGIEMVAPRVKVEDIVIKETGSVDSDNWSINVKAGVAMSTGREMLGRDWLTEHGQEIHGGGRLNEVTTVNRNLLAYMAAYDKSLEEGNFERAKKLLLSIRRGVENAEEKFGKGVFDRSKIPGLK